MSNGTERAYLREGLVISDIRTRDCGDACDAGDCEWPRCSVETRTFRSTKAADSYQRELELLGHKVTQ